MSQAVQEALDAIRRLGDVEAIRGAASSHAPEKRLPANAHIHLPPNFSAFETVEQAVDLAARQGLKALGVSNYYDFDVYGEFAQRARDAGVFPLFGLEIVLMQDGLRRSGVRVNDPGNPGKTYLCGKAITRFAELSADGARLLGGIRERDSLRMKEMTAALAKVCSERGFPLQVTDEDVVDMIVARHGSPRGTIYLQERHIAMSFEEQIARRTSPEERAAVLRDLFEAEPKADPADSVGVQGEIRSRLMKAGKPAFVPETFGTLQDSIRLVLELGGIPAYPVVADGCDPKTEFEEDPDTLVENIRKLGVHAAEFIPIRNSAEELKNYVPRMRDAGLLVTSGTEHNTLDLLPLEPACADGSPIPDEVNDIFWEGACVCAAHQFLTLHGETGYVDSDGKPSAAYASADERIKGLARIGAVVIDRAVNASA